MTTDGGTSGTLLSGTHAGYPMATVAIVPTSENKTYVGTVCQGGIYKGNSSGWTAMSRGGQHPHFHYVMRIVQHPTNANITYATDNDNVYGTQDGGISWQNILSIGAAPEHLHGLAIEPSNPAVLYVGTGHGNWGTSRNSLRVFRTADGGTHWTEITANFPQGDTAQCGPGTQGFCTSLFSIAVSPTDPNRVFVGTYGQTSHRLTSRIADSSRLQWIRTIQTSFTQGAHNRYRAVTRRPRFIRAWIVEQIGALGPCRHRRCRPVPGQSSFACVIFRWEIRRWEIPRCTR